MEARGLLTVHRFVPRRTRWAVVVVVVALLTYYMFGLVMAPTRISPDLKEVMEANPDEFVDIEVYTWVEPVPFHITRYREHGSVGGIRDQAIVIRRASPDSVPIIARDYWVQWVDLLE